MKKGSITVYLSLTVLIFLSLFISIIEGARVNAMQVKMECAVDLAYDSALAEYHRELLNEYGLFFIDTSYGQPSGSVNQTADHIQEYIDKNIDPASEHKNEAVVSLARNVTHDFYRLHATQVEMKQVSFATDHNGDVFRRQAIDYMKNVYGIQVLEQAARNIQSKNNAVSSTGYIEGADQDDAPEDRLESELDRASEELINQYEEEMEKKRAAKQKKEPEDADEIEEIEEVSIHDVNPAEKVERVSGSAILWILMKGDMGRLSCKGVQGEFVSHRNQRNQGNMPMEQRSLSEETLDKLIFDEYIMEKGGYYGSGNEHTCLDYGAEYVIAGKNSDQENLASVMHRIFAIRGIMNLAFLQGDSMRQGVIELISDLIALLLEVPIQDALKAVFTVAWAYVETTVECRDLMQGKKVPLVKNSDNWRTDIDMWFQISDRSNAGDSGIGYQDYVRFFLCLKSNEKQAFRMMDLVEMNLRETDGNSHFRMDSCMNAFVAITSFCSDFGYDFRVTRKRYYNTGVTGV